LHVGFLPGVRFGARAEQLVVLGLGRVIGCGAFGSLAFIIAFERRRLFLRAGAFRIPSTVGAETRSSGLIKTQFFRRSSISFTRLLWIAGVAAGRVGRTTTPSSELCGASGCSGR
jgi:hypothetical protein